MLLVVLRVGDTYHYLSTRHLAVERFYEGAIASLSELRIATRQIYGGYAEPTYGQIEVLPTVFAESWPPPRTCLISIFLAVTGEADAEVIFEGTAHLVEPRRDGIVYGLYRPAIDVKVTDAVYSGTLLEIFAAACATFTYTLDATRARAVSPNVDYTAEGEKLLIDNLSDMAAFFSHRFYIDGGTLYLIDCLLDNGTLALTEFDIFPSAYPAPPPVKKLTASYIAEITQYRLQITANQGSSLVGFSEIELTDAKDGTDQIDVIGGTATAFNTYSASYLPGYAVDNNAATQWVSLTGPSGEMYWAITLNAPLKVEECRIQARSTNETQSPTAWLFQGYDVETATWRTIKEEETEADWTPGEIRTFSATPPEWQVIVDGSHSYGEEIDISPACHTSRTAIEAALVNIKTVMERMRVQMIKPLAGVPKIGQRITLTDESLLLPTSVWARVSAVVWDFDNEQCVIEGEGALS